MTRSLTCLLLALAFVRGAEAAPAKKGAPSTAEQKSAGKGTSKGGKGAGKGIAAVPWGTAVALTADDGVGTKASWGAAAQATRAVVLVHDARANNLGWRRVAEAMIAEGMAVIAVDLRGHGTSAFLPARPVQMVDYQDASKDVVAAVAHLRGAGMKQVAIVGVGLGATLALRVAGDDVGISTVVALSPGLNLQGMPLEPLVTRYGTRPLLVVSASGDANGTAGATAAQAAALGLKEHRILAAERGSLSDYHQADSSFARSLAQFVKLGSSNPAPPPVPTTQKRVEIKDEGAKAVGTAFGQ